MLFAAGAAASLSNPQKSLKSEALESAHGDPMTLPIGSRLGPYEVVSALGAGGMGEVYRARDSRLHRELAIKVLPASIASDTEFLSRFQSEARAASALNHPNIVTIHDIGTADGIAYIAMELIEGKTRARASRRHSLRHSRRRFRSPRRSPTVWPPPTRVESSTAISSPRI